MTRGRQRPLAAPADPGDEELLHVQRLLSRERLSIDDHRPGRTCFISHIGAQPKLAPAPWIAHRDLLRALAGTRLTAGQRTSLTRAVAVEHGREFGVGRLELVTASSGLPMGGASIRLRHRTGGPVCLYTWGLASTASPMPCDWLLLRAHPRWAGASAFPPLRVSSLEVLAALGGHVLVLVPTPTDAVAVAEACGETLPVAAHPRFAPYVSNTSREASVLLWPHDALPALGARQPNLAAMVLVDPTDGQQRAAHHWRDSQGAAERIQIAEVTAPGRTDADQLAGFWRKCNNPKVLLRGDPAWVAAGAQHLRSLGAEVAAQTSGTQLALL